MTVLTNNIYAKELTDVIGIGVTTLVNGVVTAVLGPSWRRSTVDPNGVVSANAGSIISRTDGSLWVNTDGATAWERVGGGGGASDFALADNVVGTWGTAGEWTSVYVSASTRFDFKGADVLGASASPSTRILTGASTANAAVVGGGTGGMTVRSGDTDSTNAGGTGGPTGAWLGGSGNATSTLGASGSTGSTLLASGASDDAASGTAGLRSGDAGTSSGIVTVASGDAVLNNSGNIVIQTGAAPLGTRGVLDINVVTVDLTTQATDIAVINNTASALRFLAGSGGATIIDVTTFGGNRTVTLDARTMTTDGVSGGTPRIVGGLAYRVVNNSNTITNTNAETIFTTNGLYTIPANTLKSGTQIRFRAWGTVPSGNAADTLTIRVRLGAAGTAAQIVTATTAVDVTDAGGDVWVVDGVISIRTNGAGGTMVACTDWVLGVPDTATGRADRMASSAIDTTVNRDLTVTAQWSAASTANQVVLEGFSVWIW